MDGNYGAHAEVRFTDNIMGKSMSDEEIFLKNFLKERKLLNF